MRIAMLCMLLSALPSYGQQAPAPKRLRILTPAEIDPAFLLPLPPVDGSAIQKQELADLKRLLAARTPERFTQAKWDQNNEDSSIFASVIGPAFDLKALPATARMLNDIENDQNIAASAAKEYFHRVFPAAIDLSIVELNC